MDGRLKNDRALIVKHARRAVQGHEGKISLEDVARELELMLTRLEQTDAVDFDALASTDGLLLELAPHAAQRARRRRTLIEQVAAGDDLAAISKDLASVDEDLPEDAGKDDSAAEGARQCLAAVASHLSPFAKLVLSLAVHDDYDDERIARILGVGDDEIAKAQAEIQTSIVSENIQAAPRRAGDSTPPAVRRIEELRRIAKLGPATDVEPPHTKAPVLALIRSGDRDDDLADALTHVSTCAACRARLTEGALSHRSLVVMAIEAPRGSGRDIERIAETEGATVYARGDGRWTAVVDKARAEDLQSRLETSEDSRLTRLARATPVDVPLRRTDESDPMSITGHFSDFPPPSESGTTAAEVAAWAEIRRQPRRSVNPLSLRWAILGAAAIASAMAIAYFLAQR